MALVNRGSARSALGRLDEALADYNAAFAREPDNTYVLFNRGFLRGKRQEYREAIADFTRVIERDPNDGREWQSR
jgi:tetratricopeptide (TPR) repeat protein